MDPGIVLQQMSEVSTQGHVVAEQEDLRTGIPVIEPFAPGDEEDGLPGTGDPVDDAVPFADLPGIVLLPAIEDDQVKTLVGLFFGQGAGRDVAQDDLRMDDGAQRRILLNPEDYADVRCCVPDRQGGSP